MHLVVGVAGVDVLSGLDIDDAAACAVSGLLSLLGLELEFEELDFLLLLEECEFGFPVDLGCGVVLLAVEDQAGEEVSSEANELRGAVVVAVALAFLCGEVDGVLAVAAVGAGVVGAAAPEEQAVEAVVDVFVGAVGVAEALNTADIRSEDLSVCVGSSEGKGGGAGEESSGGESFERHGVRSERRSRVGSLMTSSSLRSGGKLLRGVKDGGEFGLNLRRVKKKG